MTAPSGSGSPLQGSPRAPAPAPITIRSAAPGDAEAVAAIYNEGIRGRGATFETVERTPDDVRAWIDAPDAVAHPFLVAVDRDGAVLGWVRASSYRPRACYVSSQEKPAMGARDAVTGLRAGLGTGSMKGQPQCPTGCGRQRSRTVVG